MPAGAGLCPEFATMGLDDRPADAQAYAQAARLAGGQGIEQAVQPGRVDAGAAVLHLDQQPSPIERCPHQNAPVRRAPKTRTRSRWRSGCAAPPRSAAGPPTPAATRARNRWRSPRPAARRTRHEPPRPPGPWPADGTSCSDVAPLLKKSRSRLTTSPARCASAAMRCMISASCSRWSRPGSRTPRRGCGTRGRSCSSAVSGWLSSWASAAAIWPAAAKRRLLRNSAAARARSSTRTPTSNAVMVAAAIRACSSNTVRSWRSASCAAAIRPSWVTAEDSTAPATPNRADAQTTGSSSR